jgi:7-keto-8-aminopelargonate synthetase-like enzyme
MIDECHALVSSEPGKGTLEAKGVIEIYNWNSGKALGGAWVDIPLLKEVIELLRQRSRPYLFSNSYPQLLDD